MNKKILLLGGAGFIGYYLSKFLAVRRDSRIIIADNFFRGKMDDHLRKLVDDHNIQVIEADLTDPRGFELLEKDYDEMYMLASVVGVDYTTSIPNEIIRINTSLILNTLEWLKTTKVKRVLFSSTSECYAGSISAFDYKVPTPEEVPLCIEDISHPRFSYAATKILGESGFHNYSRVFGFDLVVVRYHNVYGPRMGFKHVIPHLAQRFSAGENPFKIYGHDQTRAFCYIDDAVEATVLAMEKAVSGETYHIGTDEEISIGQLIRYVGTLFDYKGEFVNAETYPGSVGRRCPDIAKAMRELGYKPKIEWEEGVKRTIDWYRQYLGAGKEVFE